MESLEIFPKEAEENLQLILIAFDLESHAYAFNCLNQIRAAGIKAELYPDPTKLKKQMKYANARGAAFIALAGSEEMANETLSLKNMETGEQEPKSLQDIIEMLG